MNKLYQYSEKRKPTVYEQSSLDDTDLCMIIQDLIK